MIKQSLTFYFVVPAQFLKVCKLYRILKFHNIYEVILNASGYHKTRQKHPNFDIYMAMWTNYHKNS